MNRIIIIVLLYKILSKIRPSCSTKALVTQFTDPIAGEARLVGFAAHWPWHCQLDMLYQKQIYSN